LELFNRAYTDSLNNRTPYDIVYRLLMRDGRIKYINGRGETFFSATGKPLLSIGSVQDITTRRLAELGMQKSNRALHALSTCNGALVRATNESQLLNDVCRILVEIGGYRLAWVGFTEYDTEKSVRAVARAGTHSDYLDHVRITWSDTPEGMSPPEPPFAPESSRLPRTSCTTRNSCRGTNRPVSTAMHRALPYRYSTTTTGYSAR